MLYIIGIQGISRPIYNVFETRTESILIIPTLTLDKLVYDHGFILKNASMPEGKITMNKWPHKIFATVKGKSAGCTITLATQLGDNRYKIIRHYKGTECVSEDELNELIMRGQIANCTYRRESGNVVYKHLDTYETHEQLGLKQEVDKKYKKFIAKSLLMGLDIGFEYCVEGDEVRITKYTGSSKVIILPNFVTAIGEKAFFNRQIEEVRLNNGLKCIGVDAFRLNSLQSIEIPETVEFICNSAFAGNGNSKNDWIKIRNKNTILIGNIADN